MNIANLLTLFRIALIPILVLIFYLPGTTSHYAAAAIFFIACLTDWFDGYLPRKYSLTSKFGTFLDPVADKLIVAITLLVVVGEIGKIYVTLPALIIVGREILVSALREWMAEIGKRTSVAVGQIAKFKTTLQMAALTVLLLYYPGKAQFWEIVGTVLLYVAAVLTLWTMVVYLRAAWPDLTFSVEKQ